LKSRVTNAKRDSQLLLGKSIMVRIRDGSSDITRTTEMTSREKERTTTLALSSMNHSMHGAKVPQE
jgi:hypothetical protein